MNRFRAALELDREKGKEGWSLSSPCGCFDNSDQPRGSNLAKFCRRASKEAGIPKLDADGVGHRPGRPFGA
jgi:hypothetical protein